MARQQTPSSKDNDPGCPVWRVRKVVVLFSVSEKARCITREMMYLDGDAILMTKPRDH
jgi:hypothetical protein